MKIGIVCPYNIARGGGVQEIVLSTKTELTKRGHKVKIITPAPRDNENTHHPDIIFVGNSVDYRSPMHTTVQVSATGDIEKIDRMLAEEKFDILHFHEPWQPLLSRQILPRSTSVNIATFHAKLPETMMSRTVIKAVTPYLKSVMNYLHMLSAVSNSAAEYVAGLTDKPITIIPNGIDLTKYRPKKAELSPGGQTILYIGRLERRKGVRYLLQAYKLLLQDNPDLHLVIVGDGPERERLELLADDLRLSNLSFLGHVSEDLKLELLAEADLLCAPSVYGESFGIVLLEAMATGTVCVAGNNSGYVDVLQDVGALSIANPHDTAEFARRLEIMLHEPNVRTLWTKWAHQYVQQFSYPKIVDRYEEFYVEALKQYGGHNV